MESAEGSRGREGARQRRSPLDVIMSQIRRTCTSSDRKPVLSWSSDRTGTPENGETEVKEDKGDASAGGEGERDAGWGRVCVFLQKLGRKGDSRRLSLAHCDLTATDLLELATLLELVPQLEELDVSWNELIGGCLQALTSHLHLVVGLRALRLSGCRLSAGDLSALGEALSCTSLLETLHLSWNGGLGGAALQGVLAKLGPSLQELHLVSCELTAADAAVLGGVVSALPRLSVLDVSCNALLAHEVDGGAFGQLAVSLSQAVGLRSLRLQACGLTVDALQDLGGSLRSLPALRELDLSCNKSLAGGLNRLTLDLAHLPRLESLDLHLCRLTRDDLEALIPALPSLKALTALNLSSNQKVGGVVHSLVSALPLKQMKHLPLNSCRLDEESFTALALAVPYLSSVDVSWCKVVGGRLSLLLDALQPSVVLELRLSSCGLTTDDLLHLAAVCRRGALSSLRLLDLSYNGSVGPQGWAGLLAAGGLALLEDLDLSLRPSSSASASSWLPSLLRALPRLPALARLAAQRWTVSARDRDKLDRLLRKRSVRLEWDSASKGGALFLKPARQESSEETQPEE